MAFLAFAASTVARANGCTTRVLRTATTACTLTGLTILAQASCLNVP
jgi:hypothetical protein